MHTPDGIHLGRGSCWACVICTCNMHNRKLTVKAVFLSTMNMFPAVIPTED